jgi:diguanylate cyclase (GGDEF)-like protein/PAS domain S-box-containing protein
LHIVPAKVLITARDPQETAALAGLVAQAGGQAYAPLPAAGWEEFLALAGQGGCDLALLALAPGQEALERVRQMRAQAPGLPLVLLLAAREASLAWEASLAREALALGAQDCLALSDLDAPSLGRALALAPARLEALEQARQEALRYQSIVEHQTELICRYLPDGTLTFTNQAFQGYFAGSDLGQGNGNLFAYLPSSYATGLQALLPRLTSQHPLSRGEQNFVTAEGERRWHRWTHWGIFDQEGRLMEVQSVGRDITERKQVEHTLQIVESNLRQLIVDNGDGLVVASLEGLVLFVNPAAERIMARRSWDMVGRPFAFPLVTGQRREMCLMAGHEQEVVVEMRVVGTTWQGQPALLASLRDITELAKLREELETLSLVDELTGLYNRRGFLTLARQQVKTAERMSRRLHLFFIDLDDLKLINDRLGHSEGDRALVAASQVLKSTFRGSDIVGRVGGDEFAALALEGEDQVEEPILQRLKQNLSRRQKRGVDPFRLSFSVGATIYDPAAPRPLEELLEEADQLMYRDKRAKDHLI